MAEAAIQNVGACVFDAYGTLFDFNAATASCRDALGDKAAPLSAAWRDKQLQYTWLRSLMGKHADFWQVTGEALDYAMDSLDLDDPALRDRLLNCYLEFEAFAEVPETLERLKSGGLKTAILSNGSPDMLAAAVGGAGIGDLLDAVLSVEEVGVFKTDPKVYQLAVDWLGGSASEICFQSSNSWDAYAGSAFGYQVVWVNRYGQKPERMPGQPDAEITTLAGLPPLLGL